MSRVRLSSFGGAMPVVVGTLRYSSTTHFCYPTVCRSTNISSLTVQNQMACAVRCRDPQKCPTSTFEKYRHVWLTSQKQGSVVHCLKSIMTSIINVLDWTPCRLYPEQCSRYDGRPFSVPVTKVHSVVHFAAIFLGNLSRPICRSFYRRRLCVALNSRQQFQEIVTLRR